MAKPKTEHFFPQTPQPQSPSTPVSKKKTLKPYKKTKPIMSTKHKAAKARIRVRRA